MGSCAKRLDASKTAPATVFFIFSLPASTLGYFQSVVAKRDLRAPIIRDALNLIIHKIKRLILLPCKLGSDS